MRSENLERDEELRALYRETAHEEPPAAVDDAIRAAARRAVGSGPRPIGSPFMRAWGVPLSIAAVVVLSVSLITIMREENPGLTQAPRADSPPAAMERAATLFPPPAEKDSSKLGVTGASEGGGLGLKPSRSGSASGLGMRSPAEGERAAGPRLETIPGDKQLARAPEAAPATPRANAFPGSEPMRASPGTPAPAPRAMEAPVQREAREADQKTAAAVGPAPEPSAAGGLRSRASKEQSMGDRAEGSADADMRDRVSPRPQAAAKPSLRAPADTPLQSRADEGRDTKLEEMAGLPPAKWIERIEVLRGQGRVAEAKAGLAEFRKRYPDYVLPASLKDWAAL